VKKAIPATVLGVGIALSPTAPVQAHDPNDEQCATSHEVSHIEVGQTNRADAHRILDFDGSQVWQEDGVEKRHYRHCSPDPEFDVWIWSTYGWDGRDAWIATKIKECHGC
jgi:hypothetical protein